MKLFVTGAAGFIGSRLAERLAADGHHVVCLDALTPYYDPAVKRGRLDLLSQLEGVELVEADLRTVDLAPIVEGLEAVFHFAAQPGVRASWSGFSEYAEHNLLATQRLLAALTADTLDRFVFASSSSSRRRLTAGS